MMQVAESHPTFFAHNSTQFKSSNSIEDSKSTHREAKKRKGVHFEKFPSEENTSSTSDYIFQEGKQWRHIASYFNCEQERNEPEKNVMNELLDLCNWYDKEENTPEKSFTDEDDSEDDSPFAAFALQYATKSQPSASSTPTASSRVSSLRLTSRLRLDSKPVLVAQRKIKKCDEKKEEAAEKSEKSNLELAFQGIMRSETNEDLICKMEKTTNATKKQSKKDDFWEDVEF